MSFIQYQQPVLFIDFHGVMIEVGFNAENFDPAVDQLSGFDHPFTQHKASNKRQAEFVAGRIAAQTALATYGVPPQYQLVGINSHNAPCWPKGIIGSISHHRNAAYAVVAATRQYSEIGLDAEHYMSAEVAASTQDLIINPEEKALLVQPFLLPEQVLTLIFSAKESLYKALHPKVEQYFDFLDARILNINVDQQTFSIQLKKSLNPRFFKHRKFTGKFLLSSHEVITLIAVR
ncbi:MAG: 4'-phosphopantetheinyl transferase superfamily protein [Moraxellaceae bacterium]|nr:MAG: 4'-phosphopantetheinyl transferase superfamily protein [Moraxellaceae bacterium]